MHIPSYAQCFIFKELIHNRNLGIQIDPSVNRVQVIHTDSPSSYWPKYHNTKCPLKSIRHKLQHLVRTVIQLWAGWSRASLLPGIRHLCLLQNAHAGSGAHLAIYSMATGSSISRDSNQGVNLTTDFHLELVCRIHRDIPPFPLYAYMVRTHATLPSPFMQTSEPLDCTYPLCLHFLMVAG